MAAQTPVIYLHVGAMKTGTSYLQQLMFDNRDALREHGVLFPGEQPRAEQAVAVRDALDLKLAAEVRERANGAWDRLRAEMLAFEGRASVVSMEFLSFASRPKAKALVRSLRGAEVHVILTVRDASRVIPAQWQETTQNAGTTSWPDFVEAILSGQDDESPAWRAFQRAMHIPRMLEVWGAAVPKERLHVVLVPAPGAPPEELWRRFASVIDVDPSICTPPGRQRNASLGYASAELLRRVNLELSDVSVNAYTRTVKSHLSKQVLSGRSGEPKVTTHGPLSEFALNWNRTMADAIAKSGAEIIGDPDDLDVVPSQLSTLELPSDADVMAAARDAVAGLDELIKARSQKLAAVSEYANPPLGTPPEAPLVDVETWKSADEPLAAAVRDVASLARHAIDLRNRVRLADGKAVSDPAAPPEPPSPPPAGLVDKVLRRMRAH